MNVIYLSYVWYLFNDGGFSVLFGGFLLFKIYLMVVSRVKEWFYFLESLKLFDFGNVFGWE